MKVLMFRAAAVLLSTLAALLMVEGGLHLVRPHVDYAYLPQRIDVSHFRSSAYLPFELRPNHRSRFRMAEFDTTVVTNSLGLRDDEVDRSRPRVICLGDSFTFGFGVENDETFCAGLERASRGRYDFVNAGFADGNAPDAYALWLAHNRDSLAPAALLVSLFQNDEADVATHAWQGAGGAWDGSSPPARVLEPGTIVTPDGVFMRDNLMARFPPLVRNLLKESYVVAMLRDRWLQDAGGQSVPDRPTSGAPSSGGPTASPQPASGPAPARFRRALNDLLAAAGDARLVFHLIPTQGQSRDSEMDVLVRHFAGAHGIPVVSRYDAFEEADYFVLDGHWNAQGHAKAAAYLREALAGLGF